MDKKKDNRATVKAAWINYKGRIIAAIIALAGVFGLYILQQSRQQTEIGNTQITILTDSSSQSNFQPVQNNSNKGNITIENISGDKNVYQNDIKQKTSPIKKEIQHRKEAIDKPTIQIDKIENNGNLSVGQTGGTINQTTIVTLKPIPRHLTETETKSIRNSIPLGYSVDVNYPMSNKESENFAFEMLNMLSQSGYKITRSIYGQIVPDLEQSFYINLNPSDSTAEITIYRLK